MAELGWESRNTADLIREGLLEIGDGYRAKNSEFVRDGGLPFVRVGNVTERVCTDGLDELPLEQRDRYEPKISQVDDCLITMKGTVGRVAQVGPGIRPFVYSPQISYWRVRDDSKLVPPFLRYWLQGPEFEHQAFATKSGTDMADYINLRDQRRMRISLPPVRDQRRIAAILATFDELIEINERRIKLLEDLARSLYREWFVHFRFPGHEDMELVESELGPIPEGWEVGRLDDHLVLARGFDLPTSERAEGRVPVVSASGVTGSHSVAKVKGPGVVTGRSGTIGAVFFVPNEFWPLNTTLWVKDFRLATPHSAYFLLLSLALENHATGAAVPTLNRNHIHGIPTVRAPAALITRFDAAVAKMFGATIALRALTRELAATRDLLLPRLVTGRLDIADIDLGVLTPTEVG